MSAAPEDGWPPHTCLSFNDFRDMSQADRVAHLRALLTGRRTLCFRELLTPLGCMREIRTCLRWIVCGLPIDPRWRKARFTPGKAGRAEDVTLSGDLVRFTIERHLPGHFFQQGWTLDLARLELTKDKHVTAALRDPFACLTEDERAAVRRFVCAQERAA